MFGLGKKKDDSGGGVNSQVATLEHPKATMPTPLVDETALQSYTTVAQELGFKPAELIKAQIVKALALENIPLYQFDEVNAFLIAKRKQDGEAYWCWRPLREQDALEQGWGSYQTDGCYFQSTCQPYQKLVPAQILNRVMKLQSQFGDEIAFFVSDYESKRPDPFIMVRAKSQPDGLMNDHIVIFGVWDEPGFGESTIES